MTVQELIDTLQLISNKSAIVQIYDPETEHYQEVSGVSFGVPTGPVKFYSNYIHAADEED